MPPSDTAPHPYAGLAATLAPYPGLESRYPGGTGIIESIHNGSVILLLPDGSHTTGSTPYLTLADPAEAGQRLQHPPVVGGSDPVYEQDASTTGGTYRLDDRFAAGWRVVSTTALPADEEHPYSRVFIVWERPTPPRLVGT